MVRVVLGLGLVLATAQFTVLCGTARAEVIDLKTPSQVVVHVVAPKGVALDSGSGAYLEAASAALKPVAFARIRSIEQAGLSKDKLARCAAAVRLSCWASQVSEGAPEAGALVVLSVQPRPDKTAVLTAQLIDLEQAKQAAIRSARQPESERADWLEEELYRQVKRAGPQTTGSQEQRQAFFTDAFARWSEAMAAAGVQKPVASVVVEAAMPVSVRIDDGGFHDLGAGESELRGVSAQAQKLEVKDPPLVYKLDLKPGASTKILIEQPKASLAWVREGALWGGVSLATAGIFVTAFGVTRSQDGLQVGCIEGTGDCQRLGTPSVNYRGGNAPALDPDAIDPGGVRLVPLGTALLVAGAVWIAGRFLEGDEENPPWISLLSGLGVGAATYGVMHVGMR